MISICILTKNAEKTLEATLESVKTFSEVILLDTGSTDSTVSIAQKYPNVKFFETLFTGFGELRNKAASLAENEWIFALDSDEIIPPSLLAEISSLSLNPSFAYTIPRHNFYNNKRIRGCGWAPDRVSRIYHRKQIQFGLDKVHESLDTKNFISLTAPILHTPYRSTQEFLAKMQHYSTLFAEQYKHKRRSSFSKAFFHALFAFFRSYFLRRGFLDGTEGLLISIYNANTTFYKYIKLKEINS